MPSGSMSLIYIENYMGGMFYQNLIGHTLEIVCGSFK